jgi:hypothetical protein
MADFGLTSTTYTVADYCEMVGKKDIVVNKTYQRSDKVWPPAAQSFLIETILLGYPLPKLSLHQKTDLKTKKSTKEIVDGQQRTRAIVAFSLGELKLSRLLSLDEAKGRTYEELPSELQHAFLSYPLPIDLFTGASDDHIREVFRRMNSYTVPLSPEEQRHATFQGELKWFIYKLSQDYDAALLRIGTFAESKLVRMHDAKLYAEVIHALVNGIATTKRQHLDALYKQFDETFSERKAIEPRVRGAMQTVLEMEEIHESPLIKPHLLYSLLLAIIHVSHPVEQLQRVQLVKTARHIHPKRSIPQLSILSEALETDEPNSELREFVDASAQKTNVKEQREVRFRWFVKALVAS